jgi:hypothetical protein
LFDQIGGGLGDAFEGVEGGGAGFEGAEGEGHFGEGLEGREVGGDRGRQGEGEEFLGQELVPLGEGDVVEAEDDEGGEEARFAPGEFRERCR